MTPSWRERPTAGASGTRELLDTLASDQPATANDGHAVTPNGWWVGPDDDPDRYELLGAGFAGGEGTTYQARYHGESGAPITVAVKLLHRPASQASAWPAQEDWARWRDQLHIIHQVRNEHLVQVRTIFAGAPPHRRGTSAQPTATSAPHPVRSNGVDHRGDAGPAGDLIGGRDESAASCRLDRASVQRHLRLALRYQNRRQSSRAQGHQTWKLHCHH